MRREYVMNIVEKLVSNSTKEEKHLALKFMEQFNVDFTTDGEVFEIVDTEGCTHHEIPIDHITERKANSISDAIKLCLDDCVYMDDDDITWINTTEAMKYFWS